MSVAFELDVALSELLLAATRFTCAHQTRGVSSISKLASTTFGLSTFSPKVPFIAKMSRSMFAEKLVMVIPS